MNNLKTLYIGQNFIHLQDVDSTNNFAANLIKQTKVVNGTVILAENQFNGRGQSGNSWQSEKSENLIISLILQPKLAILDQFLLSKITCLALVDTLKIYRVEAEIKWPNDILVAKRKISGILIENQIRGNEIYNSIIGVGLNLNQVFKKKENAVSILELTGEKTDKLEFLAEFLHQFEKWHLKLEQNLYSQINTSYSNLLYARGILHSFSENGNHFSAEVMGVNKIGQLELKLSTGELKTYNNQEIKFLLD